MEPEYPAELDPNERLTLENRREKARLREAHELAVLEIEPLRAKEEDCRRELENAQSRNQTHNTIVPLKKAYEKAQIATRQATEHALKLERDFHAKDAFLEHMKLTRLPPDEVEYVRSLLSGISAIMDSAEAIEKHFVRAQLPQGGGGGLRAWIGFGGPTELEQHLLTMQADIARQVESLYNAVEHIMSGTVMLVSLKEEQARAQGRADMQDAAELGDELKRKKRRANGNAQALRNLPPPVAVVPRAAPVAAPGLIGPPPVVQYLKTKAAAAPRGVEVAADLGGSCQCGKNGGGSMLCLNCACVAADRPCNESCRCSNGDCQNN